MTSQKPAEGIRKRGETFTAYWWVRGDGDTWRQRTKGGFRTETEAVKFRRARVAEVDQGTYTEASAGKALTMERFLLDHWLPAARTGATKSGAPRRPSTVAQYETVVNSWLVPFLGSRRLVALTPRDIETALRDLRDGGGKGGRPVGDRSVQMAYVVLRMALAYALRTGMVTRNVAEQVDRPGAKAAEMSAWTADEARSFLAKVRADPFYPVWLLALTRGLRRAELAGLRWQDVDLDSGSLAIASTRVAINGKARTSDPKTAAGRRTITLDPTLVAALRDHRRQQVAQRLAWGEAWTDCGLVFVRDDGAPLSPESITQRWQRTVRRVGARPIRLHDARHTCASLLLASGVPVKVVSELLGHADVTITLSVYQHTTGEQHREAGAALTAALTSGSS